MAFRRKNSLVHKKVVELKDTPVTNGSTVSQGMALKIIDATGTVEKMVAGAEFASSLDFCPEDITGNAALTEVVDTLDIDPGAIFEAPQGALADSATAVGCTVDISADGLGVTTASSKDFRITKRFTRNSVKMLEMVPLRRAFA
jgi:hypothetical protein